MKQILFIMMLAFCAVSCNDWLDVRVDTEQQEEDQFSSKQGFYDALIGAYMTMASQDIYGERLTMSNIESLANLWYINPEATNSRVEDEDLTAHDYETEQARSAVQTIYAKLFEVIAQANMLIKYADENRDVFAGDEATLAVIQGEAYALRAYCQFDVLRLFGQVPQGATQQVELPYSYTTSIYELPAYYGFDEYITLLKNDIASAEELLEDNDPLFEYSFDELNNVTNNVTGDEYMNTRNFRLNYWAVQALKARVQLYLGETTDAYNTAMGIINATGPDGAPVIEMSGETDMAADRIMLPSECLFMLSKYDLLDYVPGVMAGGSSRYNDQLVLGPLNPGEGGMNRLQEMYQGENTGSHNRYAKWWRQSGLSDSYGNVYISCLKYYYDREEMDQRAEDDLSLNTTLTHLVIPMLRMSEVYLIAMETSVALTDVNTLYRTYMIAHGVPYPTEFSSLEEAREWIIDEYRREFFAEGQMFYTYKRTGATEMMWRDQAVAESEYVLPLPRTEYNPNNI